MFCIFQAIQDEFVSSSEHLEKAANESRQDETKNSRYKYHNNPQVIHMTPAHTFTSFK